MEITIKVTMKDTEYVVTASLYNITEVEKECKTTITKMGQDMSLTDLGKLAWYAARDGGHNPPPWDHFMRQVTMFEVMDTGEQVDPTQSGQ